MAYKSHDFMFRDLTDDEEEQFREWARVPENQEQIRRRIADGSVTILHPVVRGEFTRVTGEECP